MRFYKGKISVKNIVILLVIVLAIPLTVFLVQRIQLLSSQAQGNAKIYFVPASTTLPPDKSISVMVDSQTSKVGFVNVNLSFDITKVRLANEITISAPFTQVISKTTMAQANTNGKINLVVALAPADAAAAPSGNFEVAKIPFHAVSTTANATATVTNDNATSQIVDMNAESMILSSDPLTFTLNPATTTPGGTVNLKIQNYPASVNKNATFSADLNMNTNNFDIVGTDLVINFDAQKLTLNSATTSLFSQVKNKVIDNTAGVFSVSLLVNTGEATVKGSNLVPLVLNFTAKNSGVANITIAPSSVIAGTGSTGQNLTIAATNGSVNIISPTASPSPTPTKSPSPTPTASPSPTPTAPATNRPTASPSPTPTKSPSPTPTASTSPSPTATVYLDEDITRDGKVDTADYLELFRFYGQVNPTVARTDINKDGVVNVKDYALLYQKFSF